MQDTLDCLAKSSGFGAIGPTTARAMRDAGVQVNFEAPQPNTDDVIADAMTHYFALGNREKARK